MTKKISFKRIIIGLFLLLTVIMLTIIPIHAIPVAQEPIPETPAEPVTPTPTIGIPLGNAIDENDPLNKGNTDPTYARTGWLLNLVDENGLTTLGSQVAFFPYMNNDTFQVCNGSITTEFFENGW